ncbi:glycoside hydrolase domain-containing protein [Flavobacterium sp. RHBU_24]|uniref:glycoside hydrolase domain-containing protein n=1 Tax=Flavobacterium sp. RHBU_24 TaxID=3391185 RepID=UPI003985140A
MKFKYIYFLPAFVMALTSCNDDDTYIGGSIMGGETAISTIYPTPPSQWMGGEEPYFSAGYTGDPMPFYEDGAFHIYFLHDAINKPAGKGFHDIHEYSTTNLAHFDYKGQMVPYGGQDEPDFGIGTGSVIKAGGTYYFYYTGHNDIAAFRANNPRESVLLATSTDRVHWTKQTSFKITAPAGYYDYDFRDPHVFQNPDDGKYWMLVSTQTDPARKAVLLKFTSDNPASGNWTPAGSFYTTAPEDNYLMMECADIFKMGNYWYLTFSENWSNDKGTHYRMATSINGPWIKPANDKLDGEYFYAAKTASDGNKRYAFGWTARKAPENDTGGKEWAGNLVVHEIIQNADGTLGLKAPDAVSQLFMQSSAIALQNTSGNVTQANNTFSLNAAAAEAVATFKPVGKKMKTSAQITLNNTSGSAGFFFNVSSSAYYKIVFEPQQNRIAAYNSNGDGVTHIPFNIQAGTAYNITVIADGSICVVYVDGKTVLSNRIYGRDQQAWGLIATDGAAATFSGLEIKKP